MYRTLGGRVLLVVVDMRLEAGAVRLEPWPMAVEVGFVCGACGCRGRTRWRRQTAQLGGLAAAEYGKR